MRPLPLLPRPPRAVLLFLVCVMAACRAAEDTDRGLVSDTAWRLVPEATIGASGDAPIVFSRLVDIELDPLGRIWVADGQENKIYVFEADGSHVRTIGRKGAGPNEFGMLGGMDWAPGGALWVMDLGNSRYSVWDTTGGLRVTHPRRANVASVPWPGGLDTKGILYDQGGSPAPGDGTERIVRYRADLQPQDTFVLPAFEAPKFEVVSVQGNTRNVTQVNVPYAGLQEWRLDPDGNVWIGVTDRYRIERHRFDGTVDQVVERPGRGRPVSRSDRRKALEFLGDFERRGGRIDKSRIPRTWPLFNSFFFGDDSRMWVMLATAPQEPSRFDVFDPTGRFLGTATGEMQLGVSPVPAVRDGRMAAVVADEDGVQSVVVLRIEKPTP